MGTARNLLRAEENSAPFLKADLIRPLSEEVFRRHRGHLPPGGRDEQRRQGAIENAAGFVEGRVGTRQAHVKKGKQDTERRRCGEPVPERQVPYRSRMAPSDKLLGRYADRKQGKQGVRRGGGGPSILCVVARAADLLLFRRDEKSAGEKGHDHPAHEEDTAFRRKASGFVGES